MAKDDKNRSIVWMAIDKLIPYARNARVHTPEHVAQIAASIKEFGWTNPILVDGESGVIAGHGRLQAARMLSLTEVPVIELTGLSEIQKRAYILADNRLTDLSTWDEDALRLELSDLKVEGFDLNTIGWSPDDAAVTGPSVISANSDDVPEPRAESTTVAGDLFLLGEHWLLCGDSRDVKAVETLMQGDRATCIFTDPPYGVSVAAKNRLLNSIQRSGRCLTDIVDDDLTPAQLKDSLLPAFTNLRTLIAADDATVFVCAPQGGDLGMMMLMMQEAGLKARHVLIWRKNSPTFSMGRLDYDYAHEPILLTWTKRHKRPMGGQHKTSVWEIDKPRACDIHPTMKPVELYVNAYLNNSDRGDIVADLYAGSGTAFIAAEQTGRKCRAIEIDPVYCDVIVKRWEEFTGKTAVKVNAGADRSE